MDNNFERCFDNNEIEEQIGDVQKILDDDFFDVLEQDEYNYKIKEIIKKIIDDKSNK